MYETLLRPHEVHPLPPPRPLSQVVDKLKRMEHYREEKRQRQIAGAGKRKREDDDGVTVTAMGMAMEREVSMGTGTGMDGGTDKRARVEMTSTSPALILDLEGDGDGEGSRREIVPTAPPPEDGTMGASAAVAGPSQVQVPAKLNHSKVSPDVRGHTSYLTFARLVPLPLPNPSIQEEDPLVPTHDS